MKRIFAVTLLLLITLLCGACGAKANDTSADGTLKFGAWGESRELGFSEREDGSVWVVDENGNDVSYTPKNRTAVVKMCMEFIDKELAEDGREECTNMALVRR